MHDFLMPLNDWLITNNIDPLNLTLYINDIPDQSIGNFVPIAQRLFGITIKQVPEHEFNQLDLETLKLRAYLSGPFPRHTFSNIQTTIQNRLELGGNRGRHKIILIERGGRQHSEEDSIKLGDRTTTTGALRRQIANHDEVAGALKARYGRHFINVVLEDIDFEEQVRLFHHAHLIVALHGAGLNNMIWMGSNDGVVLEVGPHRKSPVFKNMSRSKGLRYFKIGRTINWNRYKPNESEDYVLDINKFNRRLDRIEREDKKLSAFRSKKHRLATALHRLLKRL
ncbi:MAG: glycosyltransferase family 61 protein [Pseudomonadota bacterium]